MIHHLRTSVLSPLLGSPSHLPACHHVPLHRLLSTTVASIPPRPFSVDDYLVANCGLTRAQALKASRLLSNIKSPSKPEATLSFLSGLGVPHSDIAAAVAADPRLLFASVRRVLAPRFTELSELGLSPSQIVHILSIRRTGSLRGNLQFWLQIFGSYDNLLPLAKSNSDLLSVSLEKVVKPNLTILKECGISACDIADLTLYSSRLITVNPKFLLGAVARVEELGVDRGSRIFRRALATLAFMSKENVTMKISLLHKLGFSRDDILMIAKKAPQALASSDGKIRQNMEFLMKDVSLEARYIARRPVLIMYSLEKRLMPRHCLLKVLRQKGLLNVELDYYATASMAEKKFVQKFVDPYKETIPGLADDYASACLGKKCQMEMLSQKTEK